MITGRSVTGSGLIRWFLLFLFLLVERPPVTFTFLLVLFYLLFLLVEQFEGPVLNVVHLVSKEEWSPGARVILRLLDFVFHLLLLLFEKTKGAVNVRVSNNQHIEEQQEETQGEDQCSHGDNVAGTGAWPRVLTLYTSPPSWRMLPRLRTLNSWSPHYVCLSVFCVVMSHSATGLYP